jgi:hypothetical protein
MPDHRRQEAELSRFWNDLIQPGADPARGALDVSEAETLRRIHAITQSPPPAGARARVDGAMRAQIAARQNGRDVLEMSEIDTLTFDRPAIAAPAWLPPWLASRPARRPAPAGWGWVAQFATALLLLVTLGLGYLVFGPGRPNQDRPADLPAIVAPATPAPPATPDGDLAAVSLPAGAVPDGFVGGLNHYTIPPGREGTWDWTCCVGVRLDYILAGDLTVRGAGPMQIRHADDKEWEELPAGTEVVLGTGDALLSRMEDTFESSNAGAVPVDLLDGVLFTGTPIDDPVPYQDSGVAAWDFVVQDLQFNPVAVPGGPVTLRLRQTELAAGAVLPVPSHVSTQLVIDLDETAVVTTQADFSRRNLSDGPVTVYALTLEPGMVEAASLGPEAAAATTLAKIDLPAGVVPGEVIGGLNYWTIPVETRSRWEPSRVSETCCAGPRLDYIVAGSYSVRAEEAVQVMRAGSTSWEETPAGTEVALGAGEAILSPMGSGFEAANGGSTPVELLEGVLFAGDVANDPIPPGWTANGGNSQDIFLEPRLMPDTPLRIQLREAILAPGAVTAVPDGILTQLVVTPDRAADLAIKPNPDSAKATDPAARYVKQNVGATPLVVYVLTVEPAASEAVAQENPAP